MKLQPGKQQLVLKALDMLLLPLPQYLVMLFLIPVKKITEVREMSLLMLTLPLVVLSLMSLMKLSPSWEIPVSMKKMVPTTLSLKLPMVSPILSLVMLMATSRGSSHSPTPMVLHSKWALSLMRMVSSPNLMPSQLHLHSLTPSLTSFWDKLRKPA